MTMKRLALVLILALLWPAVAVPTAMGEVFVLKTGGRVTGQWLNRDESPRKTYVVKLAGGGQLTLQKSQVKQVLRASPEQVEYERIRPSYADTVQGQWDLSAWCLERRLSAQRKTHLERIIELDPDHVKARRALGYDQHNGKWMKRDELMRSQGYVRYKGRWVTPQEVELAEKDRKTELAEKDWARKLKRWRGWLGGRKDGEARKGILGMKDPLAVAALTRALANDHFQPAQLLYIESLARIGTPDAVRALAVTAIKDPIKEVRLTCLDYLEKKPDPNVTAYFVSRLRAKYNPEVNLAAVALRRVNDPSAIGPLIDALVTVHKFKIITSKPGQTSASFPTGGTPGGGGLSVGSAPKIIKRAFQNQAVLDALASLTRQNFEFDQKAWKNWHASQQKRETLDARRD